MVLEQFRWTVELFINKLSHCICIYLHLILIVLEVITTDESNSLSPFHNGIQPH